MNISTLASWYDDVLNNGDPRVNDWLFMSSPLPTIAMTAGYLYFVKVWGPKWMETRKAFNLRTTMIIYNFAMVLVSVWMFVEMGRLIGWGKLHVNCMSVDYSTNPVAMRMCLLGWIFLLTKYIEFADTIFFVLRKKQSQVSTLHVVHHSIVPISVWIAVKYAPGGSNALFPFLNTGVHTVMYLYYGLAAFGPQMQPYLRWKKYLTSMQLLQFALVMGHGFRAFFQDCSFPRSFVFLNIFHAVLFFYLFASFYRQAYRRKALGIQPIKGGLTVSATSGPDGASTFARIGGVTITASVHYGNNEEGFCKSSRLLNGKDSTTTTIKAFNETEGIKKRQ